MTIIDFFLCNVFVGMEIMGGMVVLCVCWLFMLYCVLKTYNLSRDMIRRELAI